MAFGEDISIINDKDETKFNKRGYVVDGQVFSCNLHLKSSVQFLNIENSE